MGGRRYGSSEQQILWVPFGSVPEISAGDLHACITEGRAPCLLDVRTNREWVASRISGAVNLPITDFRSGLDVRALRAAGFRDVRQLQGGMRAWWKAGLPVVEGPES
ncbi:MAG: rhodanese-like domain-containing protein [Gammaproteobacteria bacterium]